MLSRTANDLYWMARYIERAENIARMLDITYRMSLLPYQALDSEHDWVEPWAVPLTITNSKEHYDRYYNDPSEENVLRFMVLDPNNFSSIYSCIRSARENARAVRDAITTEMWEDINDAWLEVSKLDFESLQARGISQFFDWVKMRSHLSRGVTVGTMLRNEGFCFIRLGTFLERADNTARILDVKYHTLLPNVEHVGGAVDYYQWSAILRSVSAFESYRKIYRDVITPHRIAELLILRDDIPRSLHHCMNEIYEILGDLCHNDAIEPERLAGEIHAQLHYGRTDAILKTGLHEYLMDFLEKIDLLGTEINQHFLVPNPKPVPATHQFNS